MLTQALGTLQELVQLFALNEEGRSRRDRLRLSEAIKKKYVLSCRPPATGSFEIGGRIFGFGAKAGGAFDGVPRESQRDSQVRSSGFGRPPLPTAQCLAL